MRKIVIFLFIVFLPIIVSAQFLTYSIDCGNPESEKSFDYSSSGDNVYSVNILNETARCAYTTKDKKAWYRYRIISTPNAVVKLKFNYTGWENPGARTKYDVYINGIRHSFYNPKLEKDKWYTEEIEAKALPSGIVDIKIIDEQESYTRGAYISSIEAYCPKPNIVTNIFQPDVKLVEYHIDVGNPESEKQYNYRSSGDEKNVFIIDMFENTVRCGYAKNPALKDAWYEYSVKTIPLSEVSVKIRYTGLNDPAPRTDFRVIVNGILKRCNNNSMKANTWVEKTVNAKADNQGNVTILIECHAKGTRCAYVSDIWFTCYPVKETADEELEAIKEKIEYHIDVGNVASEDDFNYSSEGNVYIGDSLGSSVRYMVNENMALPCWYQYDLEDLPLNTDIEVKFKYTGLDNPFERTQFAAYINDTVKAFNKFANAQKNTWFYKTAECKTDAEGNLKIKILNDNGGNIGRSYVSDIWITLWKDVELGDDNIHNVLPKDMRGIIIDDMTGKIEDILYADINSTPVELYKPTGQKISKPYSRIQRKALFTATMLKYFETKRYDRKSRMFISAAKAVPDLLLQATDIRNVATGHAKKVYIREKAAWLVLLFYSPACPTMFSFTGTLSSAVSGLLQGLLSDTIVTKIFHLPLMTDAFAWGKDQMKQAKKDTVLAISTTRSIQKFLPLFLQEPRYFRAYKLNHWIRSSCTRILNAIDQFKEAAIMNKHYKIKGSFTVDVEKNGIIKIKKLFLPSEIFRLVIKLPKPYCEGSKVVTHSAKSEGVRLNDNEKNGFYFFFETYFVSKDFNAKFEAPKAKKGDKIKITYSIFMYFRGIADCWASAYFLLKYQMLNIENTLK
jgi:hypothetical protein